MKTRFPLLTLLALLTAGGLNSWGHAAGDTGPAADDTRPSAATLPEIAKTPPRDEVLILPLHVHVICDEDRPDLNCKLSDDDLKRILGKVNRVWRQAGVQFHVQPILREAPHDPEAFDEQRAKLAQGKLGLYRMIANPETRDLPGLHVYYLHEILPNGVYLGGNLSFVKETARLREVEGGLDEPIPRVTSHEIGHALGLPHRQNLTNLMASGTTGTTFNEAEVRIARKTTLKNQGVMTMAEAEAKVKSAEDGAASLKALVESIE